MPEPTALQHILGYNQETGEYHKAHMLVRLGQLMVMGDRGITQTELARKVDRSVEAINNYFRGDSYMKPLRNALQTETDADWFARIRAWEDTVERGIEEIIAERKLGIGLALGTTTERYIDMEVVYPDLMRA